MTNYPPAWKSGEIQRAMYEAVGYRCEHCAMEFVWGSTKAASATNADGKPTILTVHHLDGNPANCAWTNLLVCCQRCHLHIQGVWAPGAALPRAWERAPLWLVARLLPYQAHVQPSLFDMVDRASV